MEPYFSKNDLKLFYKYIDNATNYFEYGSGGSTIKVSEKNNIKYIFSVESDIEWYNKIKILLKDRKNFNYILNEMNTLSKKFGYPGPNATEIEKINYSEQINLLDKDMKNKIDIILIDGRFRVACCLKCFNNISDNCLIIFDDFLTRNYYHVVLEYFNIIDKTEDNRMVILKKKENITHIPLEIIKKYELDER